MNCHPVVMFALAGARPRLTCTLLLVRSCCTPSKNSRKLPVLAVLPVTVRAQWCHVLARNTVDLDSSTLLDGFWYRTPSLPPTICRDRPCTPTVGPKVPMM